MGDSEHPPPATPFVVCLGASAGGLKALETFFAALPPRTGVPYVVVVHLSPDFKSLMPELLGRHTSMPVLPVQNGMALEPNHVYIIPPSFNLEMESSALVLRPQDRSTSHPLHLPIDLCLQSMARDVGPRCVAVILSGTGSDGSRGIRDVKTAGGMVFVQSREQAKFDGMPLAALMTGTVDIEAPAEQIAERIAKLASNSDQLWLTGRDEQAETDDDSGGEVAAALGLLKAKAFDLRYLRPEMVRRRMARRASILGEGDLGTYVRRLEEDRPELDALVQDLLVGVTSFFRDRKTFERLERVALPKLLHSGSEDGPIRIWVPGCSTGQEAYSIVISMLEVLEKAGQKREIKVFATDINSVALERASRGVYSMGEMADVPGPYVSKYFEPRGHEFAIRSRVRENIIFARHNAIEEPPFTKLDLLSCRNLLIYLTPEAKDHILQAMLMALRPGTGVLMLGMAESPGAYESHLVELDKSHRIYIRADRAPNFASGRPLLWEPSSIVGPKDAPLRDLRAAAEARTLRTVLEASFEQNRQTALIIDSKNRIMEVLTDPLGILRLGKGRPSDDLIQLLRASFAPALWAARARLEADQVDSARAPVSGKDEDDLRYELSLQALRDTDSSAVPYLLMIRQRPLPGEREAPAEDHDEPDHRVAELSTALATTRDNLQATIEELQNTNQEQQSTNEELVASNEELQSTNEELQSLNEELYTVNAEYQKKNEQLNTLTLDLDNLLNSLGVATLYLDNDLGIRRFNPSIERVMVLQTSDIGRPIQNFAHFLDVDIAAVAKGVTETGSPSELQVRDRHGVWLLMRTHPYVGPEGRDKGVLLTFIDVTAIKNAEEAAKVMARRLFDTNQELRERSNQLEELFSMVAHDLKRPLLAVDSMVKLALRSANDDSEDSNRVQYLDNAAHRIGELRTILQDLSELAKVSHALTDVREEVDLRAWFDELMEPFASRAIDLRVRFHYASAGGRVVFARSAGAGAVRNLVENAFVHGISNASPRIDVQAMYDGDEVRFVVSDNGRGISPEHHERIFELFRRLSPGESEGNGVGLVTARRLVEKAGGRIQVDSQAGQGARFTVRLPASPAARDPALTPQNPERAVLLVEDDPIDAKNVRKVLSDVEVVWVPTIAAAIKALDHSPFGAILLDLSLPDGHGLEVINFLRRGDGRQPPVVVLSGKAKGLTDPLLQGLEVRAAINKDDISEDELRNVIIALLDEGTPA